MRRIIAVLFILLVSAMASTQVARAKSRKPKGSPKTVPVSTASPEAAELFEKGMVDYENLHLDRATQEWRDAAKADPNFALAHAWVAFTSTDPSEAADMRDRAKELAEKVTPGEQLMIKWLVSVQENDFVTGIAAMNDLLAMFPKDKRAFFLASNWLMGENEDEQAGKMCQKALAIDKNYPAALNNLAYAYARTNNFPPAFEAMERYTKVLANEPNPQDSYAEILRMSGNFDGALDHYRAALKIDPSFHSSQLGLGDTYALMGKEAEARAEYDKAVEQDPNPANKLNYSFQAAMTWVRENNAAEADKAFEALAGKAHGLGFNLVEARAYRTMALYQSDRKVALDHLNKAESALSHKKGMSGSEREEERARILRARVDLAIQADNQKLAAKAIQQLETMAKDSRSTVIQQCYHAAEGSMLFSQQKYQDAISHLQEDHEDPYSLQLLSRAYNQTGSSDDVHIVESKLRGINTPTIEQAIVVVPARATPPIH
jgi:tetratricopeptide (TPR) repeat protein